MKHTSLFQNNDAIDVKQLTSQAKMFCFIAPGCKVPLKKIKICEVHISVSRTRSNQTSVLTRVSWLVLSCSGFGFGFWLLGWFVYFITKCLNNFYQFFFYGKIIPCSH